MFLQCFSLSKPYTLPFPHSISAAVNRQGAEGNSTISGIYSLQQGATWETDMNYCSSGGRWFSRKWCLSFSKSFHGFDAVCLNFHRRENIMSIETNWKKLSVRRGVWGHKKMGGLCIDFAKWLLELLVHTEKLSLCRKHHPVQRVLLLLFCNLVCIYLIALFSHTSGFSWVILRKSEDFLFVYNPSLLLAQWFSSLGWEFKQIKFYLPNFQSHAGGSHSPLSRSSDSCRSPILVFNFVSNCIISFFENFVTVTEKPYQKGTIWNLLNFLAKHIPVWTFSGRKMRFLSNTFANICTNIHYPIHSK